MKISNALLPLVLSGSLFITACGGDGAKKTKVNAPPTANNAALSTKADTPFTGKLMASDLDKDMLSFAVVTAPQNGTLSLQADGSFSYTPALDFVGTDQFTFSVSDGKTTSAAATVNVTIDLLTVAMSSYTRTAFNQQPNDTPLSLNSRNITQDVSDENAFDDLLVP
uniref:cadherin-like domain-containing protein n=1 Tax=Cellvibrio fontiphilus TaxID=1815559 RepID=UPI002B4BA5C9|nr:cadherin-like domain-containing protein [Cellvibrio fontiphilus]